jgi:glycosyltransferase involved in cell wall biosynthesis
LSESWKLGLINDLKLNEGKIKVVYNPCPIIKLNKEIQKENIILYAGTLNERKNYKTLINAFSIIAKEFPNWKLVFAGNGEVTQGIDLVRRLEVENQVDFKGWITGEDKYQLFSKATIFCLPSFAEGFPMSVLDAWAFGLPVITTPVGGIPDVAIDGENIILFNPNDVIALSEKLRKLIVDKDLQNKLSKEAINFSNKQFSINFISKKINNIYTKLNENT